MIPEKIHSIEDILSRLPSEPGVYLMKDKQDKIIYVGKAINLRHRVRSYFISSSDNRAFVPLLEKILGDIETIVTTNEKEALLLENNLIKTHKPRFNIKLIDDKNFLALKLDTSVDYPRLEMVRKISEDGARYFGPYHIPGSARETLNTVNRHFKLRTCTDAMMASRKRPCLQYQIKRCDAPCVFPIPKEQYAEQVKDVKLFLAGKDTELIQGLKDRMKEASIEMEYEKAAAIRDQVQMLEKALEQQQAVSCHLIDQDIFGLYREGDLLEIAVLHVRQGKILGHRSYHFKDQEFPDAEALSSFVGLYYDLGNFIPAEILLPLAIEDTTVKEAWLKELSRQKDQPHSVQILAPKRGDRAQLIELANKNARTTFVNRQSKKQDIQLLLGKLQKRLHLSRLPRRMECFDISHLQGTNTVASRVVFIDGEPAKAHYRLFKLSQDQNDDFASMYEVISRRLRRAKELMDSPENNTEKNLTWQLPDLLIIDGGKGQLASALAALKDVGIPSGSVDIVGLAKEREDSTEEKHPDRVFLPRVKDPIRLRANTAELFILSRIRDEAHRFAVTFHKKRRAKKTIRTALSDIPGVGPKRQKALLQAFGSLKQIASASIEELSAISGITKELAETIKKLA